MFDDIREQFSPFQLTENISMESHANPATFWPHAGPLMDATRRAAQTWLRGALSAQFTG